MLAVQANILSKEKSAVTEACAQIELDAHDAESDVPEPGVQEALSAQLDVMG